MDKDKVENPTAPSGSEGGARQGFLGSIDLPQSSADMWKLIHADSAKKKEHIKNLEAEVTKLRKENEELLTENKKHHDYKKRMDSVLEHIVNLACESMGEDE